MNLELSPEEFRRLGYRAVDMLAEQMASIRELSVRQPVPEAIRQRLLTESLPSGPTEPDVLFDRLRDEILQYPMGNASPHFFAWVNSAPAPLAVIAEMLAAGMNPSVAGGDHAATYVEHSVLNWLKAMLGFSSETGGLLTSGGSVANLVALGTMRHVKTGGTVRTAGLRAQKVPLIIYTSDQGHSCIQKAVEVLGIGSDCLRRISVDSDFRMDIDALRSQILQDRADGLMPVCVAASAGTVNTGAIDPLDAIADLCKEYGLWFHIDGSYGAVGLLDERVSSLFHGIQRADSIAVDPHKWMSIPVECGCVLIKDAHAMRESYSLVPAYLRDDRALPWFSEYGIQQTRGFRALKLWVALQHIGIEGYRKQIAKDNSLAQCLRDKIRDRSDFELVAAGPLSITCFRYAPEGVADLRSLNQRLVEIVQREGHVFLTTTELRGELTLRACIINFRTTEADLDHLLDAIADAGQRVLHRQQAGQ